MRGNLRRKATAMTSSPTDSAIFDAIGQLPPRQFYGEKYLLAATRDDLALVMAEACFGAAFSLVMILGLPRRGSLVLKAIKFFSPRSYERHQHMYNFAYSHCLHYVTSKLLKPFRHQGIQQPEELVDKIYAYGGWLFAV